jgi:nicotinate dehydrogenase subunit B
MSLGFKLSRRDLLKGGAVLLIAVGDPGAWAAFAGEDAGASGPAVRPRSPDSLDTWLAVQEDGRVTAYFGKMDMGQGVDTAIAQVVAEELDLPVDRVTVVMADTGLTPNQGGASGSSACSLGAKPLRNAAAQARQVLLARAATHFQVQEEELSIVDGRIFIKSLPQRAVMFGQLVSAGGFDVKLDWNRKEGLFLNAVGTAKPKNHTQYKIVGQGVPRRDIPGKILATTEFCHHVVLPKMMHGRIIRPPIANGVPVKVKESSLAGIPGARVVWKKNFLGVVAESEWDAIKASRQLKVTWSTTRPPFPKMDQLYQHIRAASPVAADAGNPYFGKTPYDPAPTLDALTRSARRIEAEYELPFQSHARMAPSVGVADVQADSAIIYSDTQKTHDSCKGLALVLGLKPENVRVIWKPGPGSYGRSDADEAAFEAAVMSQAVGRPVRVQWMRHEGHGWDPKAPPSVITVKAGLDAKGELTAWYFRAKGFSGWDVLFNAANPGDTLAGMQLGWSKTDSHFYGVPEESYDFPSRVAFWETIAAFQERASPLRCAHMRAPQEPQTHFAHECFIDEVAAASGQDPIAFRLKYLKNERERSVLEAVASAAVWERRPSPTPSRASGDLLRGRGVSLATFFGGTFVATVCEVEIDRVTGRLWPRRIIVAHDCGLIINPRGLRGTIEGNVVQGLSRAMWEEVQFGEQAVESVDWASYPILDVMEAPESIEIVTINRPEIPSGGAGEATHVTIAAALGNAVFDATGVRFRRLPLTPARLKAGINQI